jgi:hypothetical protein
MSPQDQPLGHAHERPADDEVQPGQPWRHVREHAEQEDGEAEEEEPRGRGQPPPHAAPARRWARRWPTLASAVRTT